MIKLPAQNLEPKSFAPYGEIIRPGTSSGFYEVGTRRPPCKIEQTEGAKFWLRVMNELKNRGAQDILIAVVDGLKGFPEAINAVFPQHGFQNEGMSTTKLRECLEPISKSPEEDDEAGELDKAQEVLSVVLPADEDATLPLYPGEEALDEPASRVTA